MQIRQNASIPIKGMDTDNHPSKLEQSSYIFALNAALEEYVGNGLPMLQNEPSNLLCSKFKDGYKVVGFKTSLTEGKVYFFLTNPETGYSEVGFIQGTPQVTNVTDLEKDCGCDIVRLLDKPLEENPELLFKETCKYERLFGDNCNEHLQEPCLNFSVEHPILDGNINLKVEKTGNKLYWTDGVNPPRKFDFFEYEKGTYDKTGITVCDTDYDVEDVCLDCEKLKVFKTFLKPCLHPEVIVTGGGLNMGVYQYLIAYSDVMGNELSDYYSLTNPVTIFDHGKEYFATEDLADNTGLGIKVNVEHLDTRYPYYKIVVVQHADVSFTASLFELGVFPISQDVFIHDRPLATDPSAKRTSISRIHNRKPFYKTSRIMSSSGNMLFQAGLEVQKTINLQPVVNLMGQFLRWRSVKSKEGLYKDGVAVSNYTGYMRDEVYPYAIRFLTDGHVTHTFPLIPRPPKPREIAEYPNGTNKTSLLKFATDCEESERTKVWQFENTAEVLSNIIPVEPLCDPNKDDCEEVELSEKKSCLVNAYTIEERTQWTFKPKGEYESLGEEITKNPSIIQANNPDLYAQYVSRFDNVECEPSFEAINNTCTESVIVRQNIVIQEVDEKFDEMIRNPKSIDDYEFLADMEVPDEDEDLEVVENECETFMKEDGSFVDDPGAVNRIKNAFKGIDFGDAKYRIPPGTIMRNTGGVTSSKRGCKTPTNLKRGNDVGVRINHSNTTIPAFILKHAIIDEDYKNHKTLANLLVLWNGNDLVKNEGFPSINPLFSDKKATVDFKSNTYLNHKIFEKTYDRNANRYAIAANATWIKIVKPSDYNEAKPVLEISKGVIEATDYLSESETRVSFFRNCGEETAFKSILFDAKDGMLLELGDDYFDDSETLYVVIDKPVILSAMSHNDSYVVASNAPTDGCIKVTYREPEWDSITVTFDKLVIDKSFTHERKCKVLQKVNDVCYTTLDKIGDFGYYESLDIYPDNDELYNSQNLIIRKDRIPDEYREEFERNYVRGDGVDNKQDMNIADVVSETYTLNKNANFKCRNIRHYRFPDNNLIPFMSDNTLGIESVGDVDIFPLGVFLDNDIINAFLDIAVDNELITKELRDSITGYEILRGDRTLDKSVVGKGLMFDVRSYTEGDKKAYYSNFPYNDLGDDKLNATNTSRTQFHKHPFNGRMNNKFTFHSPDFHFFPPMNNLPREMVFEGYQFGKSLGRFVDVKDHPKWVILGRKSYRTADILAIAECVFEGLMAVATATAGFTIQVGINPTVPVHNWIAIGSIAALNAVSAVTFKYARYRNNWIEIFLNRGTPHNFASYYTSVGHYNAFIRQNKDYNHYLRGLANSKFLRQGNHNFVDRDGVNNENVMFNNTDREFTYYINLGNGFEVKYLQDYVNYDNGNVDNASNSRFILGSTGKCNAEFNRSFSEEFERNIASPYVSLKTYKTRQYGRINSIRWINTNYCGILKNEYGEVNRNRGDVIFGGDTFISRFSIKRKIPLFYTNAMGISNLLPFNYAAFRNIGYPKYYVDYGTEGSMTAQRGLEFPSSYVSYSFDCLTGRNSWYVVPPSKFYLFYYGIPNFLVESTINCNYRYAQYDAPNRFYPNITDYVDWTQEVNVSIKLPERFLYNQVYSRRADAYLGSHHTAVLPVNFDSKYFDKGLDLTNSVIYSVPDVSEKDPYDPWVVYRMNDYYEFPTANGKLIDIRGIESDQLLVRFENTVEVHNSINPYRDAITENTMYSGTGGLFNARPASFNKTDLGYGGTQHKAMLSTEFGHFWVDAMRGHVFSVDPNGRNLKEITKGKRNWFKEHLPFKIINHVSGMTHLDVDNPYKGLGIVFGYDSRFKRIFLTKRDYLPNKAKGDFVYRNGLFFVSKDGIEKEVKLQDKEYFTDVSFTMAYSPMTETWISYYSFKPDYYINYHNYFQTGLNFSSDAKEEGLWSHLLTNKSYQVFYGKKYPWTVEFPYKATPVNKVLESVTYWLDSRRYHNEYDFAEKRDEGFNKAWVYNHSNNSGQLDLVVERKNDLFQKTQYPKRTPVSNEILVTEYDKKWTFNYFFNEVRNELNNNPIWLWDNNSIEKFINKDALQYNQVFKDRLRGDWFNIMLSQDKETRFKYIFKFSNARENLYTN